MTAKKKVKSLARLVEEGTVLLQKLVRMKAANENGYCSCVCCGETKKWNQGIQGGHFIDRGNKATKMMEENIHPQCDYCNSHMSNQGFVKGRYTIYMQETYGNNFVEELLAKKGEIKKFYRADVLDIIKDFKKRIKIEEKRLGC